ncbi:MAG: hypothetical protein M0D57_16030 [Sphingobacteriales bacterium JAD_PAG50586_3]|nr:MAG: hypothetical protein M0D57_16030 [Sphingobacteriales bacterium JAD_PAG50586_3]
MKINVPQPCHEDWSKMTPQDQGRFCDVCQKCVVDFSLFTDREIIDYLQRNKDACGSFDTHQLNRVLVYEKPYKSTIAFYKWAAGLALFVGVSKNVSAQTAATKPRLEWVANTDKATPIFTVQPVTDEPVGTNSTIQYIRFKVIKWHSSKPYTGNLTVKIWGNTTKQAYTVSCDANGYALFKIIRPFNHENLYFTLIDNKGNEAEPIINLTSYQSDKSISLFMADDNALGLSIITKLETAQDIKIKRRRFWRKLKFWKRRQRSGGVPRFTPSF